MREEVSPFYCERKQRTIDLPILTHLCLCTGLPASQHSQESCQLKPSYGAHC